MPNRLRLHLMIGKADKVLILGHPHTGKTTLSTGLDRPVTHLDGYLARYGREVMAVEQALKFFKQQSQWVAEGCLGYRLLDKGLEPDLIVMCTEVFEHGEWDKLVAGQETMFMRYLATNPEVVMVDYRG